MARRGRKEAAAVVTADYRARWRYLVRNPDFHADVSAVIRLCRQEPLCRAEESPRRAAHEWQCHRRQYELREKWRFPVPQALFDVASIPEAVSHATIPQLESVWRDSPFHTPVSTIIDSDGTTYVGPTELADDNTLFLAVGLTFPKDVLLAAIERELDSALKRRGKWLEKHEPRRRRLDKAAFYIAVFDEVLADRPFATIAADLGKPLSTVKSAFRTAAVLIMGDRHMTRRELVGTSFDPTTHTQTCAICSSAKSDADFCRPMKAYVGPAEIRGREILGLDPVRDIVDPASLSDPFDEK